MNTTWGILKRGPRHPPDRRPAGRGCTKYEHRHLGPAFLLARGSGVRERMERGVQQLDAPGTNAFLGIEAELELGVAERGKIEIATA